MTQRIPDIEDRVLRIPEPPGGPEIAIDSLAWVARVGDPVSRSYAFRGPCGKFAARRGHRVVGGAYRTAYRKRAGRLRKTYPRKAEKPTLKSPKDDAEVPDESDNAQWRADGGEPDPGCECRGDDRRSAYDAIATARSS